MYLLLDHFSWFLLLFRILIIILSFRLVLAVSKIQTVYKSMQAESSLATSGIEETKNVRVESKASISTRISTTIGDIFRWILALALLPTLLGLVFLFFMYPFEWLLSKSTNWNLFLHILFWFVIGWLVVSLTTIIGTIILQLSTFLVRQSSAYYLLLFLGLVSLVGFCIYGAWSDSIEFSWEIYRYETFNKIMFTVLIMNILRISTPTFNSRKNFA